MAIAAIAILYRYWFIAPVLQRLTIGQWRLTACAVAAACGVLLAVLRFRLVVLTCALIAGLLLGGTWAMWHTPTDTPISLIAAFTLHLEFCWRDVAMLTVTAWAFGFAYTRLRGLVRDDDRT